MIASRAALHLSVITVMVSACGSNSPDNNSVDNTATSTQPSLSISVSPAPSQVNKGRGTVEYDPCRQLDDKTISNIGFDPNTRQRADQIHDTYSFIGCKFAHKEQVRGQNVTTSFLTISATNLALDEFRSREASNAKDIKVNGRDAITYSKTNAEACYVTMTSSWGTIDVGKTVNGASTSERPCDRINEIAESIESAIGDR